jgi:hypothetical protein
MKSANSENNDTGSIAKIIPLSKEETSDQKFIRKCFFISKLLLVFAGNIFFFKEIGKTLHHSISIYISIFICLFFSSWVTIKILKNKF